MLRGLTLKAPRGLPAVTEAPGTEEGQILAFVRQNGSITNAQCRTMLGVEESRAWYLLKKLTERGKLKPEGYGRWRRYVTASG